VKPAHHSEAVRLDGLDGGEALVPECLAGEGVEVAEAEP
jgi:hypothetical protein